MSRYAGRKLVAMRKRGAAWWCLVGMLALLLVACKRTSEDIPSPDSGEITVYTNILLDQVKTYLEGFHVLHPQIKVNVVREAVSVLAQRLLAERNDPQADVIWGLAVTSLKRMEWRGMLSPYAPVGLERVMPQFRDTSNPPYWVGMDAWTAVFCVNTVALDNLGLPIPRSWSDLIKPIYKGHVLMYNPLVTGTGYMTVTAILQIYDEVKGWEYLDALHQNIVAYVSSEAEPCRLTSAGKALISISYDLEGVQQKTAGAPLEVIFPTEKTGWDMEASALVRKLRVKPAAKTFLDWAISDGAMRAYAANYAITAVKLDLPVPPGFPTDPTQELLDRDFPWDTANYDRIGREWKRRYGAKIAKGL